MPTGHFGADFGAVRLRVAAMWRTPSGNRTLRGAEAEVFLTALRGLADELNCDRDDHETGIKVFDRHSIGQRVALLLCVTDALTRDDVPVPAHTSANEAAIYAVFHQLRTLVEEELIVGEDGSPPPTEVRSLIRRACLDASLECPDSPNSADEDLWDSCIEELADRVLWDRDFEDEKLFVDAAPEQAFESDDLEPSIPYFADVPDDPSEDETQRVLDRLRKFRPEQASRTVDR